jgi:hypothetical protein
MPGCYYDGEWRNGRPHGAGKIYGKNGIFFEGGFVAGVATCEDGLFIFPDGSHYRGHFRDNTFHGVGRFYYKYNGYTYMGDFREDHPHGKGL